MQIITDYSQIDRQQWSAFVLNHVDGNIFQTPEIAVVYEKTKNYTPVVICAQLNNKIVGILVSVIQKEYKGVLGFLSSRCIIEGGPLALENNPLICEKLIESHLHIVQRKVLYSQYRNLFDTSFLNSILIKRGYLYEDHLNILVNLNLSEDDLWKNVHSKRRNEIRRAKKASLFFECNNTEEALINSYNILVEVYNRAKLPLPNFEFFKNLLSISNNQIGLKIFTAKKNDKIIGCLLALVFNKKIYDYYAGSFKDFYKFYPNDLIPWEVFLWGKQNNYKLFDFGGAGKPQKPYGVREYKKKFGGEIINLGRFEKIHNPLIYQLAKIGFYFWKNLKRIENIN